MKTFSEEIERFEVNGEYFYIYACWDSETPEGETDFYEVYDKDQCLTLGDPFYHRPSKQDIEEMVATQ